MASQSNRGDPWGAAALIVAPAALFTAFVTHPYLPGRLPNDAAVAAAVTGGTTRWGLVHLATSVASGLIILAFLALRRHLRAAGEERFSPVGVPFVVMGSVLFAVLPGMEFAPLAAAETGATTAEITAVQEALTPWFVPVLALSGFTFAVGVASFARAVAVTTVGSRTLTRVVVVALVVMAVARFVPLAAVQFYVQGVAALVAMWPLAHAVATRPTISTASPAPPRPAR
jgi:hypothetical protein